MQCRMSRGLLNVDSFGEDLQNILYNVLEEQIHPFASNNMDVPPGIINGEYLVDAVIDCVDEATKSKLYIVRKGYEDEPIPNDWLIDWLREFYEDSSTHTIRNG